MRDERFYGMYRGVVVNTLDVSGHRRVQVTVPAVFGEAMLWAEVCLPLTGHPLVTPAIGAAVWVEFEGGDSNMPICVGRRGP